MVDLICVACGEQPKPGCKICTSYDQVIKNIDEGTVTTTDFDNLLTEALGTSAVERIQRHGRQDKIEPTGDAPFGRIVPKKPGDNNPNQHHGKRNFRGSAKERLDQDQRERMAEDEYANQRLSVYECVFCGGDAYNGIPGGGTKFRGSAECGECGQSFSVVKMPAKNVDGPLVGKSPSDVGQSFSDRFMTLLTNGKSRSFQESVNALNDLDDLQSIRDNLAQLLRDNEFATLCEQKLDQTGKTKVNRDWAYNMMRVVDLKLSKAVIHG